MGAISQMIQFFGSKLPQEVSTIADSKPNQGQSISSPSGEAGRQAMSELARG